VQLFVKLCMPCAANRHEWTSAVACFMPSTNSITAAACFTSQQPNNQEVLNPDLRCDVSVPPLLCVRSRP
jgi:hypothetical protein